MEGSNYGYKEEIKFQSFSNKIIICEDCGLEGEQNWKGLKKCLICGFDYLRGLEE